MKEYVFTLYGRRHAARQKKRRKADTSSPFTDGDTVHTPRRKTPEGKPLSALYNTDTVHTPRRKTPEGKPLSALYNTDTVHAPRRKTPEGRYIFTLYGRRHAARRKTPEGRHIFTLYKRRRRSHTAAEISDSGYNSTLCKHHPPYNRKSGVRRHGRPYPQKTYAAT